MQAKTWQVLLGTGVDSLSWFNCLFFFLLIVQNEGVVDATMKSQLSCYRMTLLLKRVVAFILTLLVSLTLDLDRSRQENNFKSIALGLGCYRHNSTMRSER